MTEQEERWIELPEGKLRVVRRGSGPDRVFLPSIGGSYEMYGSFVDALARRSRLLVIELLGTGGSDDPAGIPSTEALAQGVLAAVDQLGLVDFDLVGLSLGGMVAQCVAGLAPERVRSLVLASTALQGLRAALQAGPRNLAMARCLLEPGDEQVTVCLTENMLADQAPPALAAHVDAAARAHPLTRGAILWLTAAAAAHDGREALSRYHGPAHLLSGALDTIFPAETQAELLPHLHDARQVIIEGAGHDLALDAPDALARECDVMMRA
jgi:pimeloyl-ACP methyl ester carboxylesterase